MFNPINLGGGRGRLRGPDAKNQGYHQPIDTSYYRHKSMPDAKFESANFSIFGDMTSPIFPLENRTSYKMGLILKKKILLLFPETLF